MSKIELVFELIAVTCLTGCMCGFHKRLGYSWNASIIANGIMFFLLRNFLDTVSVSFIMISMFLLSVICRQAKEFYQEWKDKKRKRI